MQRAVPKPGEAIEARKFSPSALEQKRAWLNNALLSLSIANLCFLYVWAQISSLATEPADRYYEMYAPPAGFIWAVVIDVLVLAGLLFCFCVVRRRARSLTARRAATAILFCAAVYGLYSFSRALQTYLDHVDLISYQHLRIIRGVVLVAGICALAIYRGRAVRALLQALAILWPLFFILAAHTLWAYKTNRLHRAGPGHAAGMLPGTARPGRVVWMIFDELDNRLLFEKRPTRIRIHEFDRLRAQSLYAGHVNTPADDTLESLPSMLLGNVVLSTKLDTSTLLVRTTDKKWLNFASQPNVFRRAREQGFNTALSGWNHPYCRLLGNDLSQCGWAVGGWTDILLGRHLEPLSFWKRATFLAAWQAGVLPASDPPQLLSLCRENNIAIFQTVWNHARPMLQNPNLNLTFLHLSVPHPPGIWDSQHDKLTMHRANYIDNLELADVLLGRIRRELEKTGDWDRSAILVSGDHSFRAPMWLSYRGFRNAEELAVTGGKRYPYVPFLLKLPGQQRGLTYGREFNNVVSADLILQILNGQLARPEQVVNWLNMHATAQ